MTTAKPTKSTTVPVSKNYMLVKFSSDYELSFVLPFEDGIKLTESFKNAKAYLAPYGKDVTVRDIKQEDFKTSLIAEQAYGELYLSSILKDNNES